jgi:hypothetical protein
VLLITAALSLSIAAQERDTTLAGVPVFEPVIKHAAPRYPSRPGLRVVISDSIWTRECIPTCRDTTRITRSVAPEVVRQLRAKDVIAAACTGGMGCGGYPEHTFIRFGIPYRLPSGFRVLPGDGSLSLMSSAAKDRGEIVHVGVEVLVYGPCPKEREPCEFPDIVLFQYFLQEQPDGSYRVVSSMVTGQV